MAKKYDMDLLTETYFADVDPQFMPDEPPRDVVMEELTKYLETAFSEADDCRSTLGNAQELLKNPNISDYQLKKKIRDLVAKADDLMTEIEELKCW